MQKSENTSGKVGRPLEPFEPWEGWKEDFLNLYRVGAGDIEIKGLIINKRGSISDDLWTRWMKEDEEFSGTIRQGRVLCRIWWEKQGRENLQDTEEYNSETKIATKKRFNDRLWGLNMRNRFKKAWGEGKKQDEKPEKAIPKDPIYITIQGQQIRVE